MWLHGRIWISIWIWTAPNAPFPFWFDSAKPTAVSNPEHDVL